MSEVVLIGSSKDTIFIPIAAIGLSPVKFMLVHPYPPNSSDFL